VDHFASNIVAAEAQLFLKDAACACCGLRLLRLNVGAAQTPARNMQAARCQPATAAPILLSFLPRLRGAELLSVTSCRLDYSLADARFGFALAHEVVEGFEFFLEEVAEILAGCHKCFIFFN